MRKQTVLLMCAMLTLPWTAVAAAADDPPTEEELQAAHAALREAVETIREYHRSHLGDHGTGVYHVLGDDFTADTGKPRLGIVVKSVAGGVEIAAVTPGGPADEAGLESGDIITRVDGVDLTEGSKQPDRALVDAVRDLEEGQRVVVEYLRNGEEGSTVVEARPVEIDVPVMDGFIGDMVKLGRHHAMAFEGPAEWNFSQGWLDMELVALNSDLAEYFGTDEGVLVIRAPEERDIGLKGGDVIVSIGNRVVKSPTHALRILRSYDPEEVVDVEIVRHGRRENIDMTVPEHSFKFIGRYRFGDDDHDD